MIRSMRKSLIFLLAIAGFQVSAQNQAICGGNTVSLNASASGFTLSPPANSYSLYSSSTNFAQSSNGVFVFTPSATATYTMVGNNGTTSQSVVLTVTVNPQPIVAP